MRSSRIRRKNLQRLALRTDVRWAGLSAVLACVAAGWALRVWRADLHVPFSYENDGQFYAVLVKQVLHGWYLTNSQLGVPFGSELFDFPQGGDQLSFLIVKALGLVSSDWALVMNLFYLLTFPLVALSAYVVMRQLGASPPASTVCSTLFALVPYHLWQGEFHLVLSAYYAVPLGGYLVIATYRGDQLFARSAGRRGIRAWASRRSLMTLAACCVIGSANLYYATFTVVLLLFAAAVLAIARRPLHRLASGLIPAAAILVVLAVNVSPTLVYWMSHGTDSNAFNRTSVQSKGGSLRPVELVLPLSHHRIAALGRLRQSYSGSLAKPEFASSERESATLGLLATAGLAWLIMVLLTAPLSLGARWDGGGRFRPIAGAAVSSLLLATVGGIAVAYLVTPDVRQWSRLSIFIAFFALAAVALLLDRAQAHLRQRRGGGVASAVLLGAVGLLAFFDQTSSEFIPRYRKLASHYHSDRAFVAVIERRLAPGSAVFQLPYMPWPEPGFVNAMTSFEPARGYLHSRKLRWSYGGMRGRQADWQSQLAGDPPAALAAAAAAGGFGGIYIDRLGYAGSAAPRLETTLMQVLRVRPVVSDDGRLSFFDARPYSKRLLSTIGPVRMVALRNATLYPAWLDAGAGTETPPSPDFPISGVGIHGAVRIPRYGELNARSPSTGERTVIFSARLSSPGPVGTTIHFPAGRPLRLGIGSRPTSVCRLLHMRRYAAIRFEVARNATLHVDRARITDLAYAPFLRQGRCRD
jgi:hypothetical protein